MMIRVDRSSEANGGSKDDSLGLTIIYYIDLYSIVVYHDYTIGIFPIESVHMMSAIVVGSLSPEGQLSGL